MKLSKTHRLHISTHVIERIEDPEEDTSDEYAKVRMVQGVVKLDDPTGDRDLAEYYYRGRLIQYRDENTYNKWALGMGTRARTFETLRAIKAHIDSQFYGPVQQKA